MRKFTVLIILCVFCLTNYAQKRVLPGADQLDQYLPFLAGKKIGLLGNQTSIVGKEQRHLVDVLLDHRLDLRFVFAPEHGFRGHIERGEPVSNDRDRKTGLPIYTFYGSNPKADSLIQSVDVLVYDLQDVGARFYTYITALHHLMQLCAEHGKTLLVLDRPNPNGDQVDGPVRTDDRFKSAVSYHRIAMVHGLTVGELAKMINGEGWLDEGITCNLKIVKVKGYDHSTSYELPVIPSPSLPNQLSVRLYPSLCLFEGTDFSVGRGTDYPFQMVGFPNPVFGEFTFIPGERTGMSKHVEGQGEVNYGLDLRSLDPEKQSFTLRYLLEFFNKSPDKETFFARADFFDKLAGTDQLRKQILAGWTEEQIRTSWEHDLISYKSMRRKYLLYSDFE